MQEQNQQKMPAGLTGRVWAAFGVLTASLLVLALTPVLLSPRTRELRHEITEVAEPTIAAASAVERSLGLQLATLRGFFLQRDSSFLAQYHRLDEEEKEALRRLDRLAAELDPEVARHAERLARLAAAWDEEVEGGLASAGPDALRRSVLASPAPDDVLAEAQSLRRSVELLERLRRQDIAQVERIEVWVNRVMVLLAALAAISLAAIGRRMHALTVAARGSRTNLEQEVDRRARLIRGISHDLKNPLGAADAHAEFLEMGIKGPLTDDQRQSIAAIRRSVGNTVRLIEDLLQLARAERGEVPVEPVPVEFGKLVREVAQEVSSGAEAKGLRLEVEVPEVPVQGRTDPRRVREVLENLVTNAIRYTPDGGRVGIRLQHRAAGADEDGGGGNLVRISVSDTGPGIAPADRERIFHEFQRAGQAGEGSGLGLAISREMARLLGGELELESQVGQGSTFSLVVPAALPGVPA